MFIPSRYVYNLWATVSQGFVKWQLLSILKLGARWWWSSWTEKDAKNGSPPELFNICNQRGFWYLKQLCKKRTAALKSQADLLPGLNTDNIYHLAKCSLKKLFVYLKRKPCRMQDSFEQHWIQALVWEEPGDTFLSSQPRVYELTLDQMFIFCVAQFWTSYCTLDHDNHNQSVLWAVVSRWHLIRESQALFELLLSKGTGPECT